MQLKKFSKISTALAGASCALLGADAAAQQEAENEDNWQFDTALLYYAESDGRVKATEGIFAAKRNFDYGQSLDLKVTLDALTGASPSGAVPQSTVQTFTRPSGRGAYQVQPGQTPLDDTFRDTRLQLNAQWTQPWAQDYRISSGVHFSREYDYTSAGINASIARDMLNKNTTLSAGFSFSRDQISPEGGRPIPLISVATTGDLNYTEDSPLSAEQNISTTQNSAPKMLRRLDADEYVSDPDFLKTRQSGDGDKDVIDLLFGVTQVINRQMIMQFNYSLSRSDGYHTDPFKILSVVDNQGVSQDHLYENRPGERTKHAFYLQTKYHFDWAIADVSYRYMRDDWEITSHTLDSRIRYQFDSGFYVEPHVRYYSQQAADFYRPFLNQNDMLPTYASADYRVGAFDAVTIGAKVGMPLASGNDLAVRLEYYTQDPDNPGFNKPGQLSSYDLDPKVNALILQVGYSF